MVKKYTTTTTKNFRQNYCETQIYINAIDTRVHSDFIYYLIFFLHIFKWIDMLTFKSELLIFV